MIFFLMNTHTIHKNTAHYCAQRPNSPTFFHSIANYGISPIIICIFKEFNFDDFNPSFCDYLFSGANLRNRI